MMVTQSYCGRYSIATTFVKKGQKSGKVEGVVESLFEYCGGLFD